MSSPIGLWGGNFCNFELNNGSEFFPRAARRRAKFQILPRSGFPLAIAENFQKNFVVLFYIWYKKNAKFFGIISFSSFRSCFILFSISIFFFLTSNDQKFPMFKGEIF